MEVWLNEEKGGVNFRFPVIPMPLGKEGGASIDNVDIVRKGRVVVYSGTEPDTITLEGFFPKYYASYCNYKDFPSPVECVSIIEDWRKSGAVLRYIATGLPINERVIITNFDWKHKDGSGNIYYTINLIKKEKITLEEYIPPKTQAIKPKNQQKIVQNKPRIKKEPLKNAKHKTTKGDTLVKIASAKYGNSAKWRMIKKHPANVYRYPRLKKSNSLDVGWVLELP